MSWYEMSRDSLQAARLAHKHGHPRSAMSRAYYAAYSALAGVFESSDKIDFRYEGNNPGHRQLLALVANNLDNKYPVKIRREVKRSLKILQTMRINADYNPTIADHFLKEESLIAVRQATSLMIHMEVFK